MTKLVTYFDNLEDRREVWRLLDKLTDSGRMAFVQYCARHVRNRVLRAPKVTTGQFGEYTTKLAYDDFWQLCNQFGLDIDAMLVRLVQTVRGA